MNNNFKFWTRRILAFIFGGTAAVVLGILAYHGDQEAKTALITITSMVLAFYFAFKAGSEKPQN